MKKFRLIALSALVTVASATAIFSTSCSKDECKDVTCQNGGVCSGGNCTCPVGYEGSRCETKSRDKFIGTYTGTEICTIGTDNYTITLAANSDALKLTYTNLYNANYTATCTMIAADSFAFSGTQSGATFTGTGKLTGTSALTVHYTITDGATSNTCTFTGSK